MQRPQLALPFPGELIIDNFAGGGGTSTGLEAAFGRPVDIAINHDPEALAMHALNHPYTKHLCESVWDIDPIEVTGNRPVGLVWLSPDCKHFSKAKGGKNVIITSSQLRESESGVYLHHPGKIIPLGRVGDKSWPFKPLVDFIIDPVHAAFMDECVQFWKQAKMVYAEKDRQDKKYYLTNACGQPPALARERDAWPAKESISDGKTSAGMDRTDDIKKGIYQSLKIGTQVKELAEMKTAIVSNLPAYRHGAEYVAPFVGMLWGYESDLQDIAGVQALPREKMRRAFDYLITLDDPVLRELVV